MDNIKIINDPVWGFISIPSELILQIIKHPYMQRLTRIRQLGMTSVVYPGAVHTRFQHSLGAFHLMTEAINNLLQKGVFIFESEAEAVKLAILMHDIGHGPFSHVLEHTLIHNISHEEISWMMMERMNKEFNGALTLAMKIFQNDYPKKFLHQLISSQLDMDRLDYLRRDSFYTGVTDGNIGADRILKTLNVVNDQLVIEAKGIYSVENYLITRRLMYWQVYLHKTTVACENMLVQILKRAKYLIKEKKRKLFASPTFSFFLENDIEKKHFVQSPEVLEQFALLDDNDVWTSIKVWAQDEDRILSLLSSNFINRKLFKVDVRNQAITDEEVQTIKKELAEKLNISPEETSYLVNTNYIHKDFYNSYDEHITILYKNEMKDFIHASELLNEGIELIKNSKYYLCHLRI